MSTRTFKRTRRSSMPAMLWQSSTRKDDRKSALNNKVLQLQGICYFKN